MSDWTSLSEEQLWSNLNAASEAMSRSEKDVLRLFEAARIVPEKWELHPWGDSGQGFWVVALLGRFVVWFNDIEDGYNLSQYTRYGVIDEYWCNQDSLADAMRRLLNLMRDGDAGANASPPRPGLHRP